MKQIISFGRSLKDFVFAFSIPIIFLAVVGGIAYNYVNPPPPRHIVISTSSGEGDYQTYAKLYQDLLKDDGIEVVIRPSDGSTENLKRLKDPKSDVDVGFVEDGIGNPDEAPNVSSLGSLYYEPIWIFYHSKTDLNRLVQFQGKKIAIGQENDGTHALALQILNASGVNHSNSQLISIGTNEAASALRKGEVDVAMFVETADDPIVDSLLKDRNLKLLDNDQAEAITRQFPFLHHLVLPHGAIDLHANIPERDVNLVSPTATLLVRDSLHPALIYPLLKAATQVHNTAGLFERQGEFPINKDFQFPVRVEALNYYKSGTPFWQRYLPFWLATLLDRFILLIIPMMALIIPAVKMIPKIYVWRVRTRIYKRYGELKYLETQIQNQVSENQNFDFLAQLDAIEDRVNEMRVPLEFSDHIYALRQNIEFVRSRMQRLISKKKSYSPEINK